MTAGAGTPGKLRVVHNSGNTEWNTPQDIVERVRTALGGRIDLDPCSNPAAQTIVQAEEAIDSAVQRLVSPSEVGRHQFRVVQICQRRAPVGRPSVEHGLREPLQSRGVGVREAGGSGNVL